MNPECRKLLDKAAHALHAAELLLDGGEMGVLDPRCHRWLIDAFDERIRADYATGNPLTAEDVEDMMAQGRELVAAARRRLGGAS